MTAQQSDRELLELAAKAAGYVTFSYQEGTALELRHGYAFALFVEVSDDDFFYWNPLTDDGDAFRLAAALCINLEFDEDSIDSLDRTVARCFTRARVLTFENWSEHLDRFVATRRAIVRAAASIGESKS